MFKWFNRSENWVGIILFIGFFCLYSATAFRVPINYADSDDLTMAAYSGGLAHPPGYPLLTLVTHAILVKFPPQLAAITANRIESLISAVAVTFIYYIIFQLMFNFGRPKDAKRKIVLLAAISGAVTYGTWHTIWLQARVFEVFPMAQVLMLWCILITIKIKDKHQKNRRIPPLLLGLLLGIGAIHHPLTLLLTIPTFIWGIKAISAKRKMLSWSALGIVISIFLSFGLYGYLTTNKSQYSWQVEPTLRGIVNFYFRSTYTPQGSAVESYAREIDVIHSVKSFFIGSWLWLQDTYIVGMLLAGLGGLILFKHKKKTFWWLATVILLSGILLTMYHKYPLATANELTLYWGTALRFRMQFVCAIPLAIFVGFGWYGLYRKNRAFFILLPLIVLTAAINQFKITSGLTYIALNHSQEVLNSLPTNSVLLVDSDVFFNLKYQQIILGIRDDLLIEPVRFSLNGSKARILDLPFENFTLEDEAIEKVVAAIEDHKEVFLYSPSAQLLDDLGIEGNPFYAVPYGYLLRVSREMPDPEKQFTYRTTLNFENKLRGNDHLWSKGYGAQLQYIHTSLMYYWERLGFHEAAKEHKNLAVSLANNDNTRIEVDNSYKQANFLFHAQDSYAVYIPPKAVDFLNKIKTINNPSKQELQYLISRAILVEPKNLQLKQLLFQN